MWASKFHDNTGRVEAGAALSLLPRLELSSTIDEYVFFLA